MAAQKGRDLVVAISNNDSPETFTTVVGREATITIEDTDVETTDAGSSGNREFLSGKYNNAIVVSFSGIFKDSAQEKTIREMREDGTHQNAQITIPPNSGPGASGVYEGTFRCTSFELTGSYEDSVQYSVTLTSTGGYTFTDAT